uniref:Uncharacterized protein n=1 Tax=Peromyscus maniculatus bairdii TaxID=230844 RepID=A0A8C8URP3_PERMB
MMHVRPRSPSVDPEPCWPPQPQGPSPAKRRRLHEPARHEPLPGFLSASPQGATLLDVFQDQQGSFGASVSDIFGLEDAYDQEEDPEPGFLSPSMDASASQAAGLHLSSTRVYSPWPQDAVAEPWPLVLSTRAKRYSPRSVWDLGSYLLRPFPSSPLQPLPPSPPPSPQEQHLPCPPRPLCKARRRLFCE